MNTKFLHVCIRVFDLEKSIAFYKNALGFTERRRKDVPEDKFTLVFLGNDSTPVEIELTYNYDQATPYEMGTGYGHIALEVDDIESLHKKHKDAAFDVTDVYSIGGSTTKIYFIKDPDGYKIEFIEKESTL